MKLIINKIVLFFILLDNFFVPINIGVDFRVNYLIMLLFIIYYCFSQNSILVNARKMVFFVVLFVLLVIINFLITESYNLMFKQLILLILNVVFSYFFLHSYNFNFVRLFKDYVFLISIAALIVLFQIVGSKLNLMFLVDYSYLGLDTGGIRLNAMRGRYHSWFYEPSFMAYAFMPVIFIAVARLFGIGNLIPKGRAIFLIIILFMAKSTLGLFGFILSILLIVLLKYPIYKKPVFLFLLIIGLFVGSYLIYTIPAVKFRVDETYSLFSKSKVSSEEIAKTNLSTYALYSNFKIAQASLQQRPILGTGIGTYELSYDNYLYDVIPSSNWRNNFKINRQDANSLLFRMLVEFGITGTLFFIFIIFKKRIKYQKWINIKQENLWVINNGILILIILRFLRQGHYTMLGFVLMVMIYYLSHEKFNLNKDILLSKYE